MSARNDHRAADVAAALGQPMALPKGFTGNGLVTGWSIDSRTIRPGDLFFALRGPNHDGHAYVGAVASQGAAAVVVDREVATACPAIRVPEVFAALKSLAAWARRQWKGKLVAVTGSAGKTTTKDVIAEMLAVELRTTKSEGNLNNEIGLPLSLLRLADNAQAAVVELGMNHAGEIRTLAEIARPNVGVVTNVGYAHMENFDSIEGIAAAKRELIDSLGTEDIAVLNFDDPRVAAMKTAHKGRTITYGMSTYGMAQQADVQTPDIYAEDVQLGSGVRFRVGPVKFESSLTGRHNISNILAGIAVAEAFDIAPERLREPVRNLAQGKMRGERREIRGITIFDDCYNSNPDAVRVMLDVLKDTPARRRIAVLGEMLELGHWAEALHRGVGEYAVECGVEVLVGIGGAASYILDAAKRKGLGAGAALFFENPMDAGRAVHELAAPGDAILFKGSRGVHVERALQEFAGPTDGGRLEAKTEGRR